MLADQLYRSVTCNFVTFTIPLTIVWAIALAAGPRIVQKLTVPIVMI